MNDQKVALEQQLEDVKNDQRKLLLTTDTALEGIDPDHPQDYLWWLQDGKFCEGYVYDSGMSLRENLIARNPTEGIILPKKKTAPKQILNDDQLERFMEAIRADSVWHDFFYTELTTGLRRGEICGLMWSDFDAAHGTLTVRRTMHVQKGGGLAAGETKTGAGKRTITLPPSTVELLTKRKKNSCSQWIFPNPLRPEQPVNPNAAYDHLKKLLQQAGLPSIRFHDLRHTFATHGPDQWGGRQDSLGHPGPYPGFLYPGHVHPCDWRHAEAGQ